MAREEEVTIRPTMQDDGSLLIEVWSDEYPTWKEFIYLNGPQMASQMVAEGIRLGYYKDLRLIEFYRTMNQGKDKDIEYHLMMKDGTVIPFPEDAEFDVEGVTITPT